MPEVQDEGQLESFLELAVAAAAPGAPMVLVSHQPPFGTKLDLAGHGEHVGSRAVRSFVLTHQPRLCFFGHIHEAADLDALGESRLVNPGPLWKGGLCLRGAAARAGVSGNKAFLECGLSHVTVGLKKQPRCDKDTKFLSTSSQDLVGWISEGSSGSLSKIVWGVWRLAM